jgi:hypothetical protein
MLPKNGYEPIPDNKVLINIGALLDIPTGFYVDGKYGESILNGGLGALTGVTGQPNNFKSTIMHYMMLSAAARLSTTTDISMSTYDTELNIHESRLANFARRFPEFANRNLFLDETWVVTDKTIYHGNEWFEIFKKYVKDKVDLGAKAEIETPFLQRDGKTPFRMLTPTFCEIDSLSEFETSDVAKIQDENELGESGGNTMHMRQGLAKTRLMMEMAPLVNKGIHYTLFSAQIGKETAMQTGPIALPPPKKLQYLKNGDKVIGVTNKFLYLMSNFWNASSTVPLINQGTKGPEYPRNPEDSRPGDTDLMIVKLTQLRSKSGPTGIVLEIVVSQSEGVKAGLTEFHYIKNQKFGLEGNNINYALALLPDVKLSRTTVRSKLENDAKLRRAMTITAELCQMHQFWKHIDDGTLCTAKELYDDLKAKGYDWDVLLNTRGYWLPDNDKQPVPFLSTMDLLKMRQGKYFPYWLEDDKKTIKKLK